MFLRQFPDDLSRVRPRIENLDEMMRCVTQTQRLALNAGRSASDSICYVLASSDLARMIQDLDRSPLHALQVMEDHI